MVNLKKIKHIFSKATKKSRHLAARRFVVDYAKAAIEITGVSSSVKVNVTE